jgi:hypothetical protein
VCACVYLRREHRGRGVERDKKDKGEAQKCVCGGTLMRRRKDTETPGNAELIAGACHSRETKLLQRL